MTQTGLSIAVIGGGIGGLAAALSLRQAGFGVQLYEQAAALGAIGAGIQISPNGARILHRLGIAAALAPHGVRPVAVHQRRWDDGRTLQRAPLGDAVEAAFGAPYYHFHRADLIAALAGALPADSLRTGHRLVDAVDKGDRVEARFDNGTRITADILIGADGIHSRVREVLFGAEKPRFTGCVAYRGLVPAERLAQLDLEVTANNWMGPAGHLVHYFVSGGRLVNFVAVREADSWTRESWTDRAETGEALRLFEGWHPQVRAIIGAVDETFKWALFDRDPLPRWSAGRIALLGDACHPMLPFMAQGAVQSIEDGAALAACLAQSGGDAPAALTRYEALRKPRATRLQEMSRHNKIRFHLPDGSRQQERDALLQSSGDRSLAAIGWLYAHDAGALGEQAA
ncbi:FAD-dependent monooxygenase [Vineibacter terrae]|uniref:FAD-dependent monooxygenase n=1 Tax=Vineibacter terrae TaxID=2586908 RepID=UPI002E31DA50|nr:FAD-dependent monooxygenase [Vineibacter terrae]HEX2890081.1 FAD-dependent monooxygenase [Vineibacter terrae]